MFIQPSGNLVENPSSVLILLSLASFFVVIDYVKSAYLSVDGFIHLFF